MKTERAKSSLVLSLVFLSIWILNCVKPCSGSSEVLGVSKRIIFDPYLQDRPSLVAVKTPMFQGYFVAYQSWETGVLNRGDIFIEEFDENWNLIKKTQVTNISSYQDSPSLCHVRRGQVDYLIVAYVSDETGNFDILFRF